MKIRCDTEVIRKGVQVARNVVSGARRQGIALPLSDIMVSAAKVAAPAKNDFLVLSATNLEVSLQYRIDDVIIDEPGMMVCPESKLAPILKEWEAESIGIDESKGTCCIKGKDSSFRITCADPKEFPKMPPIDFPRKSGLTRETKDAGVFEIDRNALADMIRKVAFIGDNVFLSVGAYGNTPVQEAVMVSNDGRRLAEIKKKVGANSSNTPVQCVIPVKTIPQILNVIKDHEGAVKIKIDKNRIFVQAGNITLCSLLIKENYPDHTEVIPGDLDKEVSAEREAFFSAVRRAGVMTTDVFKLLSFTFAPGKLHLMCNSPDVGEAQVDVPVEYEGEKFAIGLNPDYVNDLSRAIDTDKVTLKLKGPTAACVFAEGPPRGQEGNTYRYVLMPMELDAGGRQ